MLERTDGASETPTSNDRGVGRHTAGSPWPLPVEFEQVPITFDCLAIEKRAATSEIAEEDAETTV